MIPAYGKALLDARKAGMRPPGIVWVTDAWDIAKSAQDRGFVSLVVEPGKSYDMRLLHGLWVCFVMVGHRGKLAPIAQAIFDAEPRRFSVFDWSTGEREQIVWQ